MATAVTDLRCRLKTGIRPPLEAVATKLSFIEVWPWSSPSPLSEFMRVFLQDAHASANELLLDESDKEALGLEALG